MTDATWIDGAPEPQFGDYIELMKPRVMRLVIFTALVGLLAAPVFVHPSLRSPGCSASPSAPAPRARSTCTPTGTSTR